VEQPYSTNRSKLQLYGAAIIHVYNAASCFSVEWRQEGILLQVERTVARTFNI
jgi:hypothetical protein